MKNLFGIFLAVMLIAIPASAQNHGGSSGGGVRGVGGGHVPSHGPAPHPGPAPAPRPAPAQEQSRQPQEQSRQAPQQEQARTYNDKKGHPEAPHVHSSGDKWVGHDTGKDDAHYHVDHPFEHGRFSGGFGRGHALRIRRIGDRTFYCSARTG